MENFFKLWEMYLQDGYSVDLAYRFALRDCRELYKDNLEFYYDHPEGVTLDEE